MTMNREACKFFSGSFAALAFVHGAYAVSTSCGAINEPVFLGRRWGVGYMCSEAVVCSAISVGLGYLGWSRRSQVPQPHVAAPAMGDSALRSAGAEESIQPASL
jgi:hypothetical protein